MEFSGESNHLIMPFKYDSAGNLVTATVNGKQLPVYLNDKGEESNFDADRAMGDIGRLNSEAAGHRREKEKAEGALKIYTDAGLTDADKVKAAVSALDTVAKLDQKKLIDAGEVEKVRTEIGNAFKAQIETLTSDKQKLERTLQDRTMAAAFAGSEYAKSKLALPADFIQARFASNFKIEGDAVVGYDGAGNAIYSKAKPGEKAGFDEALEFLVQAHPQRDSLLKGSGSSGGGAPAGGSGGGGGSGKRTMTRAEFDAISDPATKAKTAGEVAIVDG